MDGEQNLLALLPEMCVLGGAVVVLLTGSFLPRHRQWVARLLAILALLAGIAWAIVGLAGPAKMVSEASFAVDNATGVARLIILASTALVIVLGTEELAGSARESETYALFLLASLGAMVMAGANDLLILATGYLLASIPLYALIGMSRSHGAAEAALKTYLLGALLGIGLLLGITILSGIGAGTSYPHLASTLGRASPAAVAAGIVAVLGGLMFKAGGVPGHFWVPDATQAAGKAVAAFLTTVPKVGALVAAYRLLSLLPDTIDWPLLVGILAALSMTLGNFAAFFQDDVRRLLGWSTVSQVGYVLLPVAVAGRVDLALPSLLLYLMGYAATNLTAFSVVAALPHRRTIADYHGLASSHPWLTAALVVSLLGLVGTPPTAVFIGKLTTFTAAWDGGLAWLVVLAAANTVASLFYYLRWLAPLFRHPTQTPAPAVLSPASRRWAEGAAVTAAFAVLIIGIGSGIILSSLSVSVGR